MLQSLDGDKIAADLDRSNLTREDLHARDLDNSARAATGVPHSVEGYIIPYYNIFGKILPFYRVKLFDFEPKYKQPKDSPNHIYFPTKLQSLRHLPYIILTEGEKKAALACKLGFPCVALGGVDSWKNRIFSLPQDTEMNQLKSKIKAKVPAGSEMEEDFLSPIAIGLQDLIDFLLQTNKTLIIAYDTDTPYGTKPQVQRAAATLAFEMRFRGIPFAKIKQLVLPASDDGEKVGLDDFLMPLNGRDHLRLLIEKLLHKRSAFPQHPSILDYVNRRLQKAKMSRREMQAVSIAILSDLDNNGIRLRSQAESEMYYFNMRTKKLMQVHFQRDPNDTANSPFGQHLYRQYGLSTGDSRIIEWLAAQFTGEDPVEDVTPHRVIARTQNLDDHVTLQLSDAQYAQVSADPNPEAPELPGLSVYDNGEQNILFEAEQVKAIDLQKLTEYYAVQAQKEVPPCWWSDVLSQVRLRDRTKQKMILSLLYYMSPWLHRWRGLQLPVEMILGEAGSGKSTLCELRLNILTGTARLRNAPQDVRDWHASVTNTGGLHVTDNLHMTDKSLRQKLSDEICRLVTEPQPFVEQRKLYSNVDLIRIPVKCVFAVTAIQQPFMNADILQRSIITDLDKANDLMQGSLTYDSSWMSQQLQRYGGREAWLAHHLYVLHCFFKLIRKKWNPRYQAKHRLINFEQAMCLMAEVFNIDSHWIPGYLSSMTDRAVTEADWAFEGISAFCDEVRAYHKSLGTKEILVTASAIADWASQNPEYDKCEMIINSRRIGRYLATHKALVASACGLLESGTIQNRIQYKVLTSQQMQARK